MERHGLGPTPPSPIRPRDNLPPSRVVTTAADASANSYDARSRSFRYTDLFSGAGAGSVTEVIKSPGSITFSLSGVFPGTTKNSPIGTLRVPFAPWIWIV